MVYIQSISHRRWLRYPSYIEGIWVADFAIFPPFEFQLVNINKNPHPQKQKRLSLNFFLILLSARSNVFLIVFLDTPLKPAIFS